MRRIVIYAVSFAAAIVLAPAAAAGTLTVTTSAGGSVTGGGIDCGPSSTGDCSDAYPDLRCTNSFFGACIGQWAPYDYTNELTATASPGYTFVGWSGNCWSVSGNTCYVNWRTAYVAGNPPQYVAYPNPSVTATFQPATSMAVRMRGLSAGQSGRGILVRWSTASEVDSLGFHVYREVSGRRVRVSRTLVAAKGRGLYSFLDRSAPRGKAIRYWIQEVAVDGSRGWHGPTRFLKRA